MFAINVSLIEVVAQASFEGIGSFLYLILLLKAWLAFGRRSGYATAFGVMAVFIAKTGIAATQLAIPIEELIVVAALCESASAQRSITPPTHTPPAESNIPELSNREIDVLRLIAQGARTARSPRCL